MRPTCGPVRLKRFGSDIFTLSSLQTSESQVLVGLRDGSIHHVDARFPSNSPCVVEAERGASVASLVSLADNHHFLASHLNQKICLYDLRGKTQTPLVNYSGQMCQSVCYPLALDSSGSFVLSCGQDHVARAWKVSTGELMSETKVISGSEVVKCVWTWNGVPQPGIVVGGGTSETPITFYGMTLDSAEDDK